MNLLCVALPPNIPEKVKHLTPEIGSTYTWVEDWIDGNGKKYYFLAEFPDYCVYDPGMFATLPDQEPSVVNEEEKEAIIYQR